MNRNLNRDVSNGVNAKRIRFAFRPNGTSDPLATEGTHRRDPLKMISTIVRSAQGRWTVTMRDNYRAIVYADASVRVVSATDIRGQISGVTNEGTASPLSFVVRALAGATETDVASDAQNWVHVFLDVEDSAAAGV